jgi:hypothetical protein
VADAGGGFAVLRAFDADAGVSGEGAACGFLEREDAGEQPGAASAETGVAGCLHRGGNRRAGGDTAEQGEGGAMNTAAWICVCVNVALAVLFFEIIRRASRP